MRKICLALLLIVSLSSLQAQDNYEIQVYSAPTMNRGQTIFELHSNFTFRGNKNIVDGVLPSWHALHETIEITHGITDNFELGFYLFTNYTAGYGWKIIGTHIRPRIAAPEKWNLPVGLSLSAEIGWQKKEYSGETFSMEIRPIIDKTFGKLYLSLNPTLGVTFQGVDKASAPAFAPNFKASYAVSPKWSLGAEYYGDLGPLNDFEVPAQQNHAIFLVADIYSNPNWEVNFGPGFGLTPATDGLVLKLLLGRRINWKKPKP
ncbi:MAG: hypothetical protein JO301_11190 [Chitinophagaceae bacterium]|nr:hypothetical protein [Chitinophagaceae bacterium]